MTTVCEAWAKGNGVSELTTGPIPQELRNISAVLVDLQEQRHQADYDLTQTFDRLQVLESIKKAEDAMSDWNTLKRNGSSDANVFLSAPLLHSKWNKYNK